MITASRSLIIFIIFISILSLGGLISIGGALAFGPRLSKPASDATVWLGRPDGSRSCEPESGLGKTQVLASFKEMGIRVRAIAWGSDGKVRAMMCGMPTGRWVGVKLAVQDRVNAEATGWRVWPEGMALEREEALE
jgi:hypothetical protein